MRGNATIFVTCDRCKDYDEEVSLTATARGGYDERNVDGELARLGWQVEDGQDICPDCVAQDEANNVNQ